MNGRFSRLSLRSRLMVVGLAGVAGALLVGGLSLYAATSTALDRVTESSARSSAQDVAFLVDGGRLPDPVPVSGAQLVQVVDAQHRVIGGSATADRLTPIVTPAERARLVDGAALTVPGGRAGLSGHLTVAGVEAGPSDGRVAVIAAVPTADLETSRRVLRTLMLLVFPVLLLLLAVVAWRVIGSALQPVEQLRHGAERIGAAADPTERLPVPPSSDEISALATTLNGMLERLSTASAQQRAFVADAAHELRSPLASMRTQLEVAARLGDESSLPADLLAEVDRLSALVEDLLVLARSGADAAPRPQARVDLPLLLAEVQRRYAGSRVPVRLRHAGGLAAHDGEEAAATVTASPQDLQRAVGNLLDNAVRHARSEVRLTWESGQWGARVTVADDGSGIPAADRERVFDRFARLDDARDRDSGGSGLGLPITRELLRRNGARVWLEDARPGVRAVIAFDRPPPGHGPDRGASPTLSRSNSP